MNHSIAILTGLVAAVSLAGCVGTQRHPDADMVGTKRVLAMSQSTERATPHQLQRLHAAFLRDDGTLLLQIHGRPVNEAKTQPCTLELPPPKRPAQANARARRVEVPTSALRLGWDTNVVNSPHRPIPIGSVLFIKTNEAYVWDTLAPPEGRAEEIRLVHRLGSVSQWEILHQRARPTAAQARFTIYEVRPTMVPAGHRAALALMPFALAEDVMVDVSHSTTPPRFVAPPRRDPLYFHGSEMADACNTIWNGIKALGRVIGLVKRKALPEIHDNAYAPSFAKPSSL